MSNHYKLYYFNLRARAEPIRILLHHALQQYEAVDFAFEEWDSSYKSMMPLKKVPVLEVTQPNGHVIQLSQTTAILRYLAKKHGKWPLLILLRTPIMSLLLCSMQDFPRLDLEANSVEEQAICDMFGEQIQDYIAKARDWSWTFFGFQPAEKRDEFFEKDIQPIVDEIGQIFGEQLKKNGNGYFVGSKITWFDIFLAEFVDKIIGHAKPGVFSKYPIIEQHHKKIFSLPSIAKYVKERPPRPY